MLFFTAAILLCEVRDAQCKTRELLKSQAIAKRQQNVYTRKEVKEEFRTSIVLVMVR